jgi:hypothetical protein
MFLKDACHSIDSPEVSSTWKISSILAGPAQEHVNDPLFPSLSSYDGIPPNKTYQAAALINAARNTGGLIGEVFPTLELTSGWVSCE